MGVGAHRSDDARCAANTRIRLVRGPFVFRSLTAGGEIAVGDPDFLDGREVTVLFAASARSGASFQQGERVTMSEKQSKTQSTEPNRGRRRTEWHYPDRVADDEIAAAIARDRDAAPLDIDWSKAVIEVPAKKKAISIRVDPAVLDFFKNEGPGYQRRINAVLRSYVEQKQKRGKSA
jgi:uncharacterized protein (DUF4415 family)